MSADDIRYEQTDARTGPIVKYAIGLLIFTAISAGASWAVMYGFREMSRKADPKPGPMEVRDPSRLPPQPRLQIHPTLDASEMQVQDRAALDSYGWVDAQKGTVHIPVAVAIDLLVQRGVPTRAAAPAATAPAATSPASPAPGQPAMVQEADSPDLPGEPKKPEERQ